MGKDLKGKELGKGLLQRKDERYVYRYTDKYGKRVEERFENLEEAKARKVEVEYLIMNNMVTTTQAITLDEWFETYIETYVRPNTKSQTEDVYRRVYKKRICPYIGNMAVQKITTAICQRLINSLAEQGYRKNSIQHTKVILSTIMKKAEFEGLIFKNPCAGTTIPNRTTPAKDSTPLTREEEKELLEAARKHSFATYAIVYTLLNTGIRASELDALCWEDFSSERRQLHVRGTKTANADRVIPLSDDMVNLLNAIKKTIPYRKCEAGVENRIFLTRKGYRANVINLDAIIRRIEAYIAKEREIKGEKPLQHHFHPHKLRHTFASRCVEAGVAPKALQKIMGHSNIEMTLNHYVDVSEDYKARELSKLANEKNWCENWCEIAENGFVRSPKPAYIN